ncbi:YdcF family protein [Desulfovibrio sp. OttesenSCG-928-O18]|nr:YdcF family protein [Desulfovibrio sp. OttesenSCG-928-O18]
MAESGRFRNAVRRVLRLGLISALVFFIIGTGLAFYGIVDSDMRADVAVVLGNEVYADGRVSARLAARLDAAEALFREKRCHVIIVSGGTGKSGQDEATAMGRYLTAKGVPSYRIVRDHHGVNTWETAKFTAAYMKKYGLDSAIVVSQYFHVARSRLALRFMGVKDVGTAAPKYFEERDLYSIPREVPGLVWYLVKGLLASKF